MAFEGHQNTSASSFLHQNQQQQSSNKIGGGTSSSVVPSALGFIHSASWNEDSAACLPWFHDAPRKLADTADWDGQTDLQGLVNNIVDEPDTADGYFNEGLIPTCNSIWSPKPLKEGPQQCFPFDTKSEQNHSFFSNCKSQDTFRQSQMHSLNKDVAESSQLPNGLATNQSWFFNFSNGANHSVRPKRAPPGLSLPSTGSTYQPQAQQSTPNKSYGHRVNNIPDLRDFLKPQNELNSSNLDPFDEDHCTRSGMEHTHQEENIPEHVDHLVRSLRSLMPPEQNPGYLGCFSNKQKQQVAMNHDDSMTDQWKTTSPAAAKQSTSGVHIPPKFTGEFHPLSRVNNGAAMEQTETRDVFRELPDFIFEITKSFQEEKSCFAPVDLPNKYWKIPVERENINASGYSKQHFQPGQMQSNIKPQMQKGKVKMQTSGFQGGSSRGRHFTNPSTVAGDKQFHSQNHFFDLQRIVPFHKISGENGLVNGGTKPQFTPAMYTTNDHRRHPGMPFNSNMSPRFQQANRNVFSGMHLGDVMSPHISQRGENAYQASTAINSTMNQGSSSVRFSIYVDKCYEQWKYLEKERRTTETFFFKTFSAEKKVAVSSSINSSKQTHNFVIIHQLIEKQMQEQTKVSGLLDTIERLHRVTLHTSIHTALSEHQKAICGLQASLQKYMPIMSKQQQRACFTDSKDAVVSMDAALMELTAATRKLCKALWQARRDSAGPPRQQGGCVERKV